MGTKYSEWFDHLNHSKQSYLVFLAITLKVFDWMVDKTTTDWVGASLMCANDVYVFFWYLSGHQGQKLNDWSRC